MKMRFTRSIRILLLVPCLIHGFSIPNGNGDNDDRSTTTTTMVSRRDTVKGLVFIGGALVYGKLVGDTLSRVARGIEFPAEHERRVASTIATTLVNSVASTTSKLRVLEVGIGSDCRLIRRGLYNDAFRALRASTQVKQVDIVGVDLTKPKDSVVTKAESYLQENGQDGLEVELTVLEGDILQPSSQLLGGTSSSSSFDAVICCLTLCSVADPRAALERIRGLLRPNGGCLGYIEHVAVDPDEPYRALEWQQETLDPLQQAVADNCHLHRYTEETIASVFEKDRQLTEERFLVDSMWPVSCQSCGVVQRMT